MVCGLLGKYLFEEAGLEESSTGFSQIIHKSALKFLCKRRKDLSSYPRRRPLLRKCRVQCQFSCTGLVFVTLPLQSDRIHFYLSCSDLSWQFDVKNSLFGMFLNLWRFITALFVLVQEHCCTGLSSQIFSGRKANLSAQLTCDLGVNDSVLSCIY